MPITAYGREKLMDAWTAAGVLAVWLTGTGDSGPIGLNDSCDYAPATDNGTTATASFNPASATPSVSTTDTNVSITTVSIRNSGNTITYLNKTVLYSLPNGGTIDINDVPISLVSN